MTRLQPPDVDPIPGNLADYDDALRRKTGLSLRQIACRATGTTEDRLERVMGRVTAAAVPVSSGLGVIPGFSHAVAAIVAHLGFRSFVPEGRDVEGIVEALERGADILLLADDQRFVALSPGRRFVVDNAGATARGFVAGLEAMRGEIAGTSALVLGCGPVGMAGAEALLNRGATVSLLDSDRGRALSAARGLEAIWPEAVRVEEDEWASALGRYDLIFEATPAGGFIESHYLSSTTLVAAPGMPCALTEEALDRHGHRVLHDALEIGTATMTVEVAAEMAEGLGPEKAGKP